MARQTDSNLRGLIWSMIPVALLLLGCGSSSGGKADAGGDSGTAGAGGRGVGGNTPTGGSAGAGAAGTGGGAGGDQPAGGATASGGNGNGSNGNGGGATATGGSSAGTGGAVASGGNGNGSGGAMASGGGGAAGAMATGGSGISGSPGTGGRGGGTVGGGGGDGGTAGGGGGRGGGSGMGGAGTAGNPAGGAPATAGAGGGAGVGGAGGAGVGGAGGAACTSVKINEVLVATSTSADEEFVELYNPCSTAVDLAGYRLVYRPVMGVVDTTVVAFTNQTIAAGDFLVVGSYLANGQRDVPFALNVHMAEAGGVGIRSASGALLDAVGYAPIGTLVNNGLVEVLAAIGPPAGQSIVRRPNGRDTNNNAGDFAITVIPSPGATNN